MRQREEDKNKIFIFCASRLCAFRAVFGLNYFPLFFSAVLVLIVVDRMKASIDCINYHFRAPAIAARSFARDDVWIRRKTLRIVAYFAVRCGLLDFVRKEFKLMKIN